MIGREEIFQVRQQINDYVGSKVKIRANKGRKKIVVRQGVIEHTYPSIFVVKIDEGTRNASRTVCYTYTDVLTHSVELSVCNDGK